MKVTNNDTQADISFILNWMKNGITHRDVYFSNEVNFWQDYFPDVIKKEIIGKPSGYKAQIDLKPGQLLPEYSGELVKKIKISQLDMSKMESEGDRLGLERYYPKGIIKDICGIYRQNVTPFRFVNRNGATATVDFNHPLAGIDLKLAIEITRVEKNQRKLGGTSIDWMDLLTTGPGIQAWVNINSPEFITDKAFNRDDSTSDDVFYETERMVHHIDERAQDVLKGIYRDLLMEDSVVLDMMASWQSHLPEDLELKHLDGLGLNQKEMSVNPRLDRFVVHDLNQNQILPYPDGRFDAVICSLSVEYLIRPFEVFEEVARILKPGGSFIVTFSNRWFPPKAIDIWKHIHEFERMSLVSDYFLESGRFNNIHTLSKRGYPRPYTDKYFPGIIDADPIYVVKGTCK